MYKLLLATDRPEVLAAFGEIRDWERLGFKPPRTADSADAAEESLRAHHADAVAVALPPEEEQKLVRDMGCPHWHLRPIMRAAADSETVLKDVVELELLLSRTRADYSNDPYSDETMMLLQRHDFFRRVIAGEERNPERIRRYMRLLRSRMDPEKACVLLNLRLSEDGEELSDHWRYGNDRLEVAMRNIFGAELKGMRLLVSIQKDERIFLLACPMLYRETPPEEDLVRIVTDYTRETIDHVREYLGMSLEMTGAKLYPSVTQLNAEAAD